MFRYLAISHQETSHLLFGDFATRYFSRLFGPRRFATLVFPPIACQFSIILYRMKKLIFENWYEDEFRLDVEFNARKKYSIGFSSSSVYYRIKNLQHFQITNDD